MSATAELMPITAPILPQNVLKMTVNNQHYDGWKDIRIETGVEQLSGQATLAVTERWPNQAEPRPIKNGDKSVISIGDDIVTTGHVDAANPAFDEHSTRFEVRVRDVTADLCDCSAIFKTGQWRNSTIKKIITDLITPYTIELVITDNASTQANATISSFNIEEGETCFDCIDRLCKIKALMAWSVGDGKLYVGFPGVEVAEVTLAQGVNLKSLQPNLTQAERFSEYIVKAQGRGTKSHAIKESVKDESITRHRPLVILAEDHNDGHTPKERARYEQSVRQGKGNRMTARVQGWRMNGDTGKLWRAGMTVPIASDYVRYHGEMVIAKVTYIANEREGTVCDFELVDKRAFERLSENKYNKKHKAKRRAKAHGSDKDMGAL